MSGQTEMPEFDRYAKNYEELVAEPVDFFHRRKIDVLLALLQSAGKSPEQMHWLDFGCGRGDLLRLGRDRFSGIAGCDVSPGMLEACAGLPVKLQDDPARAPFPDNTFDLVTVVCVYHHVPLPERSALTRELARLLRPGGWCVFIEHNPLNPMTQIVVKRSPVDENAILLTARESARLQCEAGLQTLSPHFFLYVPAPLFPFAGWVERFLAWLPLGGQYFQIGVKQGS
jgi:SAM-dependent methyltransferase